MSNNRVDAVGQLLIIKILDLRASLYYSKYVEPFLLKSAYEHGHGHGHGRMGMEAQLHTAH